MSIFKRSIAFLVSLSLALPSFASAADDKREYIDDVISRVVQKEKEESLSAFYSRFDTLLDEYERNFIFQKMIGQDAAKAPKVSVEGRTVIFGERPRALAIKIVDVKEGVDIYVNDVKMPDEMIGLPELQWKFFEARIAELEKKYPLENKTSKKTSFLLWSLMFPEAQAFFDSSWTPWIIGGITLAGAFWVYNKQRNDQKKAKQRAAAAQLAAQQAAEQAVKPTCCYIVSYYMMSNYGQCKNNGGYATGETDCSKYKNTVQSQSPLTGSGAAGAAGTK